MSDRGPSTVLVLGGTTEGRELAARFRAVPGLRVVESVAGRTAQTRSGADVGEAGQGRDGVDGAAADGEVRTGGFGGPEGLAAWVAEHAPVAVVDATHPFAERITRSAVAALTPTKAPLLRLQRPGWTERPGDTWLRVPDLPTAAARLPTLGARPFLTVGRQGLAAFGADPLCVRLPVLARCVEAPDGPLPPRWRVLLDRGPFRLDEERVLLADEGVDVLVTKDSGGAATAPKLDAARERGLTVVLVDRPPVPGGVTVVATLDEAADWLAERLAGRQGQSQSVGMS